MSRVSEAAALMNWLAQNATPGRWVQDGFEYDDVADEFTYDIGVVGSHVSLGYTGAKPDAEHIAAADPPFVAAVAKALTDIDAAAEYGDWNTVRNAITAIADAYLT